MNGCWGPKRDPLYIVIPITVIYVFIFISGIAGNVSTCVVILTNKLMHTATNYYLFSLAVSDLLLLISGLPPELFYIWSKYPYIFGEAFCVLQGFIAETSANATVLTITAFTIERYVAICHPFLAHTTSRLSRVIKFIIAIWILSICLAIPQAMSFGIYYERVNGTISSELYVCTLTRIVIPYAFEISSVVFFLMPMTVISILYILIGIELHKLQSRNNILKKHHLSTSQIVARNQYFKETVRLVDINIDKTEDGKKQAQYKRCFRNTQSTKHVVKMLGETKYYFPNSRTRIYSAQE